MKKRLWLIMLSIVLITPLIAAFAIPPCLIATIGVSSKFGARFYKERIWLQVLKILRKGGGKTVRELRRARKGA
jgi:hypothetical protein